MQRLDPARIQMDIERVCNWVTKAVSYFTTISLRSRTTITAWPYGSSPLPQFTSVRLYRVPRLKSFARYLIQLPPNCVVRIRPTKSNTPIPLTVQLGADTAAGVPESTFLPVKFCDVSRGGAGWLLRGGRDDEQKYKKNEQCTVHEEEVFTTSKRNEVEPPEGARISVEGKPFALLYGVKYTPPIQSSASTSS